MHMHALVEKNNTNPGEKNRPKNIQHINCFKYNNNVKYVYIPVGKAQGRNTKPETGSSSCFFRCLLGKFEIFIRLHGA